MTYLVLRELSKIAQDVLIVTSSLTQDLTVKNEYFFKTGSVRALGSIIDVNKFAVLNFLPKVLVLNACNSGAILQAIIFG